MEKTGFIERRPDAEDQRVSRVYLTKAGHAIQEDAQQVWQRLDEEAFGGLTTKERTLPRRLFLRIRDNLRAARNKS
jgi:DNA-binding MarR family transcriptional regulator